MNYEAQFSKLRSSIKNSVQGIFLDSTEMIKDVFNLLKKNEYTERNKLVYNDCDNKSFIINLKDNIKGICLTNQEFNFIILLYEIDEDIIDYEIYRYYNDIQHLEYSLDENIKIKKALKNLGFLSDFTDNINGNDFIHRPNLEYFKSNVDNNFRTNHHFFNHLLKITQFSYDDCNADKRMELMKNSLKSNFSIETTMKLYPLLLDIKFTLKELKEC
jgi:hypothetical protein